MLIYGMKMFLTIKSTMKMVSDVDFIYSFGYNHVIYFIASLIILVL